MECIPRPHSGNIYAPVAEISDGPRHRVGGGSAHRTVSWRYPVATRLRYCIYSTGPWPVDQTCGPIEDGLALTRRGGTRLDSVRTGTAHYAPVIRWLQDNISGVCVRRQSHKPYAAILSMGVGFATFQSRYCHFGQVARVVTLSYYVASCRTVRGALSPAGSLDHRRHERVDRSVTNFTPTLRPVRRTPRLRRGRCRPCSGIRGRGLGSGGARR